MTAHTSLKQNDFDQSGTMRAGSSKLCAMAARRLRAANRRLTVVGARSEIASRLALFPFLDTPKSEPPHRSPFERLGSAAIQAADILVAYASLCADVACFAIGGPLGLSPSVIDKAVSVLSISKMTFTHEMARMLLMEQLYRAFSIRKGSGYHK